MQLTTKQGDTLIEVLFALAVFSLLSILSIKLMNIGVASSESNLEATQARSELDIQAESIRFIYDSYIASLTDPNSENAVYAKIWDQIPKDSDGPAVSNFSDTQDCAKAYESVRGKDGVFFINTRKLAGQITNTNDIVKEDGFREASLYPRILYSGESGEINLVERPSEINAQYAEGFWATMSKEASGVGISGYNVYLQACWNAPGKNTPTVLDTVIRLYDPTGGE